MPVIKNVRLNSVQFWAYLNFFVGEFLIVQRMEFLLKIF